MGCVPEGRYEADTLEGLWCRSCPCCFIVVPVRSEREDGAVVGFDSELDEDQRDDMA